MVSSGLIATFQVGAFLKNRTKMLKSIARLEGAVLAQMLLPRNCLS